MKPSKKGISKSRLPSGLEGVCRLGKAKFLHKTLFSVNIKNYGPYLFNPSDAKTFEPPEDNQKVIVSFIGNGKKIYFPYKVVDIENRKTFYEKK